MVKDVSDKAHKELKPDEVYNIFKEHYVNKVTKLDIPECHFKQNKDGSIEAVARVIYNRPMKQAVTDA